MIRIIDSSYQLKAIIKNIIFCVRSETINAENILKFEAVLDSKSLQYIKENHMVEFDGDYFDISYYEQIKNNDGSATITVEAEHISYRLNDDSLDFFTRASETPTQILTALLNDTIFSVGTIDFTDVISYSITEGASKRQILVTFVQYLDGELDFNGLDISIVSRRGNSNPKIYTVNKNVEMLSRIYDRGIEKFNCKGINIPSNEVSLGDNILVVDKDLSLQENVRIIKLEYEPYNNMEINFDLANIVENVADSFYRIETEAIAKNVVYNGTKISPDEGFVAERSDNKAKIEMNATTGITVFTRSVDTDPYVGNLTIDVDGNIVMSGKITLQSGSDVSSIGFGDLAYLNSVTETEITNDSISTAKIKANAVTANEINVTQLSAISANLGTITAGDISSINLSSSTITGTTITIGSGNNVFKVTSFGIHLGNDSFTLAPFKVTVTGSLEAKDAVIDGQFTTTRDGEIVTEIFANDTGGYAIINNPNGHRNVQIGSDPLSETGLLLIFNGLADVSGNYDSRRRASFGIENDVGYVAFEGGYSGNQRTISALGGDSVGGYLNIWNTNENRVILLSSTSGTYNTGNLFLYDDVETLKARFGVNTANKTGLYQLYNTDDNIVVEGLVASTTDAGIMRVKNSTGDTRVEFFCANEVGQGGRVSIFDTSGNTAVLRYNGTNLQVSKSGGGWINIA